MTSMTLVSHWRVTARLALAAFALALGLSSCGRADRLTAPTSDTVRGGAVSNAPKATVPPPAAPTPISPLDGATAVSQAPTLSWSASAGATAYVLQVAPNTRFTGLVVNAKNLTSTSFAASGLLANTVYYWRVAAKNVGGTSAYSPVCSFTTGSATPPPPAPPAAPVLVSPANHAVGVASNATLAWNAVTGANSYRVQVSSSSTFATLAVDSPGLTGTSLVVTGLSASTVYYWRVCAANAAGEGAFSAVFDFTVAGAALQIPAIPALLSPAAFSTGQALNPVLSWAASTDASSYNVQVSTSSTFATTVANAIGVAGTSYALSGLQYNTTYYWRVSASNAAGTSAWSQPLQFSTVAPDPCATVTSLDGTVVNQTAEFVSFRSGRLRFEADGDVPSGAIQASAPCAASATPSVNYIGGTGDVTLAGTNLSVVGGTLNFPPLLWGTAAEPAVVVVDDAAGNVLEIIWPSLDPSLPPGPPILRLQLASYDATRVSEGVALDIRMTFRAQSADGAIATFTVVAPAVVVPAQR